MQNNIPDLTQRSQALNVSQSFIVQAPAGSGKTELLTQRYLKLLSQSQAPEEIIAITFTNKAVAEMQERIIKALNFAATNPEPTAAHEKQTWQLAKKVLIQDGKQQWSLLSNPNRLRVTTIDALCLNLASQLPIQSKLGADLAISNDAYFLYQQAALNCLKELNNNSQHANAIATLLLHLDNDLNRVKRLLITMLAKRDQWLSYTVHDHTGDELRAHLEAELLHANNTIIKKLCKALPKDLLEEIDVLSQYAANQLPLESQSNIKYCAQCLDASNHNLEMKAYWLGIAELLLVKNGNWRKQGGASIGFPAPSKCKNKEEQVVLAEYKKRFKELLLALHEHQDFQENLQEMTMVPNAQYTDLQWQVLESLLLLLPYASAHLKLVFAEHKSVDYVENSLSALHALGNETNPTDLALTLDYQINHILVDEFQDTSVNQYRLIEKLTYGWQHNDGRSLFIVGDPMQSIYRFRQAEVGLFLHARRFGINDIKLNNLVLHSNFRSNKVIVDWNNQTYQQILPKTENASIGAVSFSESHAIHSADTSSNIYYHSHQEALSEAQTIAEQIQKIENDKSIAILVRSRSQLIEIIPQLQEHDIPYQAIDIEKLSNRPVIQDLLALTKAMLHLGDRISWLAICRAPWCGLTLEDLHIIANSKEDCIWQALQNKEMIKNLSADGQQRIEILIAAMQTSINTRQRYLLRDWINNAWLALQGDSYISDNDRINAQSYFDLLEEISVSVDSNIFATIENKVMQLFAKPQLADKNPVQLMTIHKSKGLEFDVVFLPDLGKRGAVNDKQLLQWLEYPDQDNIDHMLLAPISQRKEQESIYNYIAFKEKEKESYERARLLYVATTRAKQQLYLSAIVNQDDEGEIKTPNKSTLLGLLWPACHEEFSKNYLATQIETESDSLNIKLKRLPLSALKNKTIHQTSTRDGENVPELVINNDDRSKLGTVIHYLIQQITEQTLSWWEQNNNKSYLSALLSSFKLPFYHHQTYTEVIHNAIDNMIQDNIGQWLLAKHNDDHCEYGLSSVINNEVINIIIDRTFVDENDIRWIIDYKTSQPNDESVEQFIENEKNTYQKQLALYAKIYSKMETRQIKTALYFPLISKFCEHNTVLEKISD